MTLQRVFINQVEKEHYQQQNDLGTRSVNYQNHEVVSKNIQVYSLSDNKMIWGKKILTNLLKNMLMCSCSNSTSVSVQDVY